MLDALDSEFLCFSFLPFQFLFHCFASSIIYIFCCTLNNFSVGFAMNIFNSFLILGVNKNCTFCSV